MDQVSVVGINALNRKVVESSYDRFCTAVKLVNDCHSYYLRDPKKAHHPRSGLSAFEIEDAIKGILRETSGDLNKHEVMLPLCC